MTVRHETTERVGLYDPAYEHDACGVAFVARLDGKPSRETVVRALAALANLEHRGASGADLPTSAGSATLAAGHAASVRRGRATKPVGLASCGLFSCTDDGTGRA